jgi:hypothetical protein
MDCPGLSWTVLVRRRQLLRPDQRKDCNPGGSLVFGGAKGKKEIKGGGVGDGGPGDERRETRDEASQREQARQPRGGMSIRWAKDGQGMAEGWGRWRAIPQAGHTAA